MEKAIQDEAYRDMIAFLRKRRRELEMSQEDLAKRLNCAQNVISTMEMVQRRVDIVELAQFCNALALDFLSVVRRFWAAYDTTTDT